MQIIVLIESISWQGILKDESILILICDGNVVLPFYALWRICYAQNRSQLFIPGCGWD